MLLEREWVKSLLCDKEKAVDGCGKKTNIKNGRKLLESEINDLQREYVFRNNLQVILIFILVALWWWKNQFQPPQHLHHPTLSMLKKTRRRERKRRLCLVWSRNDSTSLNGKVKNDAGWRHCPSKKGPSRFKLKMLSLSGILRIPIKECKKSKRRTSGSRLFQPARPKDFQKASK